MKNLLLFTCIALAAILFWTHRSLALETCDSQACIDKAQSYLKQLDAFAFDQVWQAFTPLYQSRHDQLSWQKQQSVLREAYGPLVVRILSKVTCRETFYHAPDGQYCLVQFRTSFVNKHNATETVIIDVRDPDFMPIAEFRIN